MVSEPLWFPPTISPMANNSLLLGLATYIAPLNFQIPSINIKLDRDNYSLWRSTILSAHCYLWSGRLCSFSHSTHCYIFNHQCLRSGDHWSQSWVSIMEKAWRLCSSQKRLLPLQLRLRHLNRPGPLSTQPFRPRKGLVAWWWKQTFNPSQRDPPLWSSTSIASELSDWFSVWISPRVGAFIN